MTVIEFTDREVDPRSINIPSSVVGVSRVIWFKDNNYLIATLRFYIDGVYGSKVGREFVAREISSLNNKSHDRYWNAVSKGVFVKYLEDVYKLSEYKRARFVRESFTSEELSALTDGLTAMLKDNWEEFSDVEQQ